MLEWERGRRLKKYGTVSYKYNAGGIRQEKQNGAEKRVYYTEGTTIHREVITGGNTPGTLTYYYDQTGLCAIEQDGLLYYVIKNLQGDIVMILDASGSIQAQYVYDAWGNHKIYLSSGTLIYDNITGLTSGGYANNIGVQNPFRYRGYYWDQETGLYYLNSRYYDPEIGRFINADDIEVAIALQADMLNGLNLYSYCMNNPVMYSDPSGHSIVISLFIAFVIGAAIGGTTGAITGLAAGKTGWDLWSGVLGGAVLGGVLGVSTALGGLFGIGAIGAKFAGLGLLAATVASFGAGMVNYGVSEVWGHSETDWDWGTALAHGGIAAVQGAFSFGIGALMGYSGNWSSLNKGQWGVAHDTFKQAGSSAVKSVFQATGTFIKNNIGQILIRAYMKGTFATPWGLLRLAF